MSELVEAGHWSTGGGWDEPGVLNLVIVQSGVQGTGLFAYSGTPALGNPPIWQVVAPGVTKDPYGNTVSAIMNIGSLTGAHAGWDANALEYLADATGTARIVLDPGKSLIEFLPSGGPGQPPILTIATAAGTDSFGQAFGAGLVSTDNLGRSAQLAAGTLVITGNAISSTIAQTIIAPFELTFTGAPFYAFDSTIIGTSTAADPSLTYQNAESWHTLGTLANYTVNRGRFRLNNAGETEIDIDVSSAGANAGVTTFSVTVPAAYRPASQRFWPLASTRAVTAGDTWPRALISAAGGVSVVQTASVTAQLGAIQNVPLTN